VAKIPFSLETLSDGKVAMFQALKTTGSPRILTRLKSSLVGISSSRHYVTQALTISYFGPFTGTFREEMVSAWVT
jgi:hypothetical protein